MINTLNPSSAEGASQKEQVSETMKRLNAEYGKPAEKPREAVKKLGKDEFFKLMVAQIKNQDPTSPYKNEQLAAQMAQFTALEQMFNVNQNLEKLGAAQAPLQQLGAASLIGKYVTSDASRFVHTEGKYSDLTFELPADVAKARIQVFNAKGEVVKEIERFNLKKGSQRIEWDGRNQSNVLVSSGSYSMQISCETDQGKPLSPVMSRRFAVHGVGFEGRDTVLYVGDQKAPQKILLSAVSRIESGVEGSEVKSPVSATPPESPLEERAVPGAEVGKQAQFAPLGNGILGADVPKGSL